MLLIFWYVYIAGSSGHGKPLLTNCFRMETPKNWLIYQYRVSFEPDIEYKKVRLGMVGSLRHLFINEQYVFDGETMFTITRFQEQVCYCVLIDKPREWVSCLNLLCQVREAREACIIFPNFPNFLNFSQTITFHFIKGVRTHMENIVLITLNSHWKSWK